MQPEAPKRLILVIDDDPDIRAALRDTLEDNGYAVAEANSGSEALSFLRSHPPPALIFIDWNMAPMNAPQFMDEFVKEPSFASIPVVLITADMHAPSKVKTGRYHGYLTKPVDLDLLLSVLQQFAPEREPPN